MCIATVGLFDQPRSAISSAPCRSTASSTKTFKKQIDEWIHVFRSTKPAPGTKGPLIPGDPEREAEGIRSREGIPLIKSVVDNLLDISKRIGIPFKAL